MVTVREFVCYWSVLILSNSVYHLNGQEPTITLTDPVELAPGTFITGENKGFYDQFLGIPYAQPPLGQLRFRVNTLFLTLFQFD